MSPTFDVRIAKCCACFDRVFTSMKWAPLLACESPKSALLLACERPNVARVSAGFLLQWNEPHFWLWVLIDRQINVTTFVTRIIVSSRLYLLLLYARTARTLNARSNYQKIRKKGRSARKKEKIFDFYRINNYHLLTFIIIIVIIDVIVVVVVVVGRCRKSKLLLILFLFPPFFSSSPIVSMYVHHRWCDGRTDGRTDAKWQK